MSTDPQFAVSASADSPAAVQSRGVMRLVIGAVCLVAGIFALVLPDRTLLILGFLIGVQLVIVGLVRVWAIRTFAVSSKVKLLGYLLALLTIVAGILCMIRPSTSLVVFAVFVGVGWIADGAIELVTFSTGAAADRWSSLTSGILSLVGGLVVLLFPRSSLIALAQVTGVILLVIGAGYLASGITRWRATSR